MKQGEIYLAQLAPTRGKEQDGKRPILIVSGNAMNQKLDVVIVCPFSSKLKGHVGAVLIEKNKDNGLAQDSEVITFQIRTISKLRLGNRFGQIDTDQMREVLKSLNEVLVY